MKILVLQLARLGDIFQTWPTFHALAGRGDEVHVLVRPRFKAATDGCDSLTRIHMFETEDLLAPVLSHPIEGFRPSLERIDSLMHALDAENFDRVINLSFSPLSSWIAFDLEKRAESRGRHLVVAGYTRHSDGALSIPDDASAYFFAQIGFRVQTGKTELVNRLSLPRIFATIAGVDPVKEDWRGPSKNGIANEDSLSLPEKFIAVHIGASNEAKTLDSRQWGEIAARVFRRSGLPVVLLGAPSEISKAEEILRSVETHGLKLGPENSSGRRVFSVVGQTSLRSLFNVVDRAEVLLAGDSALVHVASLVGTKVLNVSSRSVSHWETGPASRGSRIICYGGASPSSEQIVRETMLMLDQAIAGSMADRFVSGPLEDISDRTVDEVSDFTWALVSAIYLGTSMPKVQDARILEALQSWCEVHAIESHQLQALQDGRGDAGQISVILDRVDQLTSLIVEAEPRLGPIERWWSTEKIRFAPDSKEHLIEKHKQLNDRLGSVLMSLIGIEDRRDGHQLDI